MLAFRAPVPTAVVSEVCVVASEAVCAAASVAAAAAAVSVADTAAQLPVGTSPARICTLTTRVPTKEVRVMVVASGEVQAMLDTMLSPASRLWSAM